MENRIWMATFEEYGSTYHLARSPEELRSRLENEGRKCVGINDVGLPFVGLTEACGLQDDTDLRIVADYLEEHDAGQLASELRRLIHIYGPIAY